VSESFFRLCRGDGIPREREKHLILQIPTIFLDFDGVLHTMGNTGDRPFHQLPLLEDALCRTDQDFQIIISSSWRFHYTLDELGKQLGLLERYVVGVTPEIKQCSDMRYQEILELVQTHGLKKWIALDDADWEFPPNCEHLIRCDPKAGLQQAQVNALLEWLRH